MNRLSDIEEVGQLFKNDPTFDFIIKLPQSYFLKIVDLRKKRLEKEREQLENLTKGK